MHLTNHDCPTVEIFSGDFKHKFFKFDFTKQYPDQVGFKAVLANSELIFVDNLGLISRFDLAS